MGEMLGNKRQDRGKKKFRGPEIVGGDFLGKCQKRGGKTFWRFQKVVGIVLGVTTIFGGEFFRKNLKKKNPRGGIWKIVNKKIQGGFFRGVVYRGTCVGECWEIKDKIGEKKISGGQKFGGELLGEMQKTGGTTFRGGGVGGAVNPNKF